MIESRGKRLGLVVLGATTIAAALFVAAANEGRDVGVALLTVLPFGLALLMVGAARLPAPGSGRGIEVRVVDGGPATVFAIARGQALLVGLVSACFSLAGVGMVIFLNGYRYAPTLILIVGAVAALWFGGVALRVAISFAFARGGRAVGEIVLSPDGLELRGLASLAGRTTVPWDALQDVFKGEVSGSAYLGLEVKDFSAIRGSGALLARLTRRTLSADLAVGLGSLRADPDLLFAAVGRAVHQPHDRATLASTEAPEAIARWLRADET